MSSVFHIDLVLLKIFNSSCFSKNVIEYRLHLYEVLFFAGLKQTTFLQIKYRFYFMLKQPVLRISKRKNVSVSGDGWSWW